MRGHTGTSALFTSNVPCTRNSSTILTVSKGYATTAGLKFRNGIEAFVIPCFHASYRACVKTSGTQTRRASFQLGRSFLVDGGVSCFAPFPIPAVMTMAGRGGGWMRGWGGSR